MDINTFTYNDAIERGFSNKTDTYYWGILAIECEIEEGSIPAQACATRGSITSLNGTVYILLSIASVLISSTVVFLLLSPSPVTYWKQTLGLFVLSLITLLSALLIYEVRLKALLNDPISWAIYDEKIHTTLAGMDAPLHIPSDATFELRSCNISQIFIWLSFFLVVASLVIYILRFQRTRQKKKYIYGKNKTIASRLSMTFNIPREKKLDGGDPDVHLKSRRVITHHADDLGSEPSRSN